MAIRKTIAAIAGASLLVLSTTAAAAPIRSTMQDAAAARAATPTANTNDLKGRYSTGGTWVISILALLAFIAGVSRVIDGGNDQPESP